MNQLELITPMLTLIIWTFLIFLMMAFGRIRFMSNPQDAAHSKDYKDQLPAWVNRTADNYNHLFEQPVAFYVVTLSIALINNFDNLIVQLAWAYVLIRIVHSLVQITINIVLVRFFLFASGWLVIAYMTFTQIFLN
ncbi:MAG: MAPEG family protein [SAR86 cluster bacterium]|uniref:MAPEG family protein n=1 Tax=SAR86 cluster bacterium TaxID=2030880 RepID=A0A368C0H8_9GAMM|nr:MAG: MAPEG family protein [SAR86 cluster bacterium]